MKKHIPPFLLAVWPYLFVLLPTLLLELLGLDELECYDALSTILSAIMAVSFLAVLIGNCIYALRTQSLTAAELARWAFIIKLCHIPMFVVVFLLCLLFVIAIAVPAVLMAVIIMVPGMFFSDLIMVLISSCYGFRAIKMARKDGLVEKKFAVKHTILHCIFVLDVISAGLLWRKLRNAEKLKNE